jgi:hypothetical protein
MRVHFSVLKWQDLQSKGVPPGIFQTIVEGEELERICDEMLPRGDGLVHCVSRPSGSYCHANGTASPALHVAFFKIASVCVHEMRFSTEGAIWSEYVKPLVSTKKANQIRSAAFCASLFIGFGLLWSLNYKVISLLWKDGNRNMFWWVSCFWKRQETSWRKRFHLEHDTETSKWIVVLDTSSLLGY